MEDNESMIGKRFGRLVVVSKAVDGTPSNTMWTCACDCGRTKTIREFHLRKGHTQSCGCLRKDIASVTAINNSTTHGLRKTRLYRLWLHIKERCNNPNCAAFNNYGGRGIRVCDEWTKSFQAFYDWAHANGYRDDLTIDRIDTNGDYCPDNCRWASMKEQANNTRANALITFNGETHTMSEWANIIGINYSTIRSRRRAGRTPAEILSIEGRLERVHSG